MIKHRGCGATFISLLEYTAYNRVFLIGVRNSLLVPVKSPLWSNKREAFEICHHEDHVMNITIWRRQPGSHAMKLLILWGIQIQIFDVPFYGIQYHYCNTSTIHESQVSTHQRWQRWRSSYFSWQIALWLSYGWIRYRRTKVFEKHRSWSIPRWRLQWGEVMSEVNISVPEFICTPGHPVPWPTHTPEFLSFFLFWLEQILPPQTQVLWKSVFHGNVNCWLFTSTAGLSGYLILSRELDYHDSSGSFGSN